MTQNLQETKQSNDFQQSELPGQACEALGLRLLKTIRSLDVSKVLLDFMELYWICLIF